MTRLELALQWQLLVYKIMVSGNQELIKELDKQLEYLFNGE